MKSSSQTVCVYAFHADVVLMLSCVIFFEEAMTSFAKLDATLTKLRLTKQMISTKVKK